jgi:hypothetical protein
MQGTRDLDGAVREQCGPDVDPASLCREDWFPEATTTATGTKAGIKKRPVF